MATPTLRLVSNIPGLCDAPQPGLAVEHTCVRDHRPVLTALRVFVLSFRHDVILLDGNEPYLWLLCLLRLLLPVTRCKLVSVDIMFTKPRTWKQRLAARLRRLLLRGVDRFVHYFKDLRDYERYFGVGPDRSTFVPFKVNGWDKLPPAKDLSPDGDYVFTGGRSLRDLDTFAGAMRRLPYPGLLLYHDTGLLRENGTQLDLGSLPPNVRAVEDNGSGQSWIDHMRRARIVVLTTLPDSIRAIGVSSYLTAMALEKCVVMTEGPATRDVLHDEAILVPPSNPAALAEAIRQAWEDDALRARVAQCGRAYAVQQGGETRLFADLLRVCASLVPRPEVELVAVTPR